MFRLPLAITPITAAVVIGLSACSSSYVESPSAPAAKPADLQTTVRLEESALKAEDREAGIATRSSVDALPAMNVAAETVMAPMQKRGPFNLLPQSDDSIFAHKAENRENYAQISTNPIVVTSSEPTSTFSVDVDSGSYANVRRLLNRGALPPGDAVRVEEMINYFSYNYSVPSDTDTPFSITTELATSPWNEKTHLLHIGLKGYEVAPENRPAANLVFLIDVSGSMSAPNKLGLVKPAMKMLVNQLDEDDTVSIVVYAGASGAVLEPTAGDKKKEIARAIDSLQAGGSTNGRAGIELAYSLAAENFEKDAANRVILVTDGDFNVGLSDVDQLKKLIEKKRESGIALTTLGFGEGNYNDHLMEQLADVGNGAYAYIDTLNEARKVLSEEVSATLMTIAKDVKIQVEFNPALVSEYRLIGYENRHLANEDFANDKVDAGDIGAGHTVTALYEIALVGSGGERNTPKRYGASNTDDVNLDEIAELRLRYKAPQGDTSKLIAQQVLKNDVIDSVDETSSNFRFSAAVAALGQQLRDAKYLHQFDIEDSLKLATGARGTDEFGYRQEFLNLVRLAKELNAQPEHAEVFFQQKEPRG